ncbi:putative transporter [Cyphellophora attinorum]|uniref:Putative transporter n=1 Tax=Cyphellophora attinorum TaxID=1664694 RepID=A0A0N1GXN9_9EURO|nr:putative transporter [Phialophora attinorum]KPI35084.1 putative transporter [Phialophora attinorum]
MLAAALPSIPPRGTPQSLQQPNYNILSHVACRISTLKTTAVHEMRIRGPKEEGQQIRREFVHPTYTIVRIVIAALTSLCTMTVTLASAIFATAIPSLIRIYGTTREIGLLGVALYVLGFAFGPLVWAALSEIKGRYLPFIASMFLFIIFSVATGASNNIGLILFFRFLGGFFGAGPLTLSAPIYADMFTGRSLGIAMVSFAFVVFLGPVISQPIGGFIVENPSLGWRWTEYICAVLGAVILIPTSMVLEESYAPVLQKRAARRARLEAKDDANGISHEEVKLSFKTILSDFVARPLTMLLRDPIVLLMSIYGSFVYALLYLFLVGYPTVFQHIYHMRPGVGGLPALALIVGEVCAVLAIFAMQPWIMRKAKQNQGVLLPEWQLPVAVPGSIAFAVGILWFGWSGYQGTVHWIVPTLSGILSGFGLLATFIPSISYLTQARAERATSAVAAHTMLRSFCAAGFPMFATYMYEDLGVQWASTLLGGIALLLTPVPILLYIYGSRLRSHKSVGAV